MHAFPLRRLAKVVLALAMLTAMSASSTAQLNDILSGGPLGAGELAGGATAASPEQIVSVIANFTPPSGGRSAILSITAAIEAPWYTYSITQKPHGATPTKISIDPSDDFRVIGDFRSTLPPKIVEDAQLGLTLEEFSGEVTWQAPVEFRPGADLNQLKIKGAVRAQVCKVGTCLPPTDYSFEASRLDVEPAAESILEYTHPNTHATIRGYLEPRVARPGSTVNLVLTADPAPGWHIYEYATHDSAALGNKPTVIGLSNTSGFALKSTVASSAAKEGAPLAPGLPALRYYEGQVKWTTPIVLSADAKPGQYPIEGYIGFQTCLDTRCDLPRGAKFAGTIEISAEQQAVASALTFTDAKYGEAAQVAANQPRPIDAKEEPIVIAGAGASLGWSLPLIMLAGLLGGFILNFMPCVLPVIGLKILSFAEQAGRSRAQILKLNIWYALGTLTVFMALATLASLASLGLGSKNLNWGEQFSYTTFNIVMVGVVFSMALSFLGVWEIPIPGFVGSGKANDLAHREGVAGAYSKGVLATILATPCSGPALGPVFGFTINQPPAITFVLFACIALGMSAPYLLIGAFPTLIRFLPKPGAWMETFKNLMGFVMLGTIVFLLSFMDRDYVVPAFAMMVGLWAACWWIGRTPLTESLGRKLVAWGQGALVAGIVVFLAFTWLVPRSSIIPWQPFSPAELARLRESGNTVLVDFTADWCLTCKANLLLAIETDEVRAAIQDNKIVPMLADYTKTPPDITDALESLQSRSIPLLAIFPADRPDQPIVLRDVITKQQLLEAIQQAGPSKKPPQLTAARE